MPTATSRAATTTDAARVAAARRWYRLAGFDPVAAPGATVVTTPEHPDTWVANFALPDADAAPGTVTAALSAHVPAGGWQVAVTDAMTPPWVEAELALAGFDAAVTVIEMLAAGAVASPQPLPEIALRPVADEDTRRTLEALLAIDHAEGLRTGAVDAEVAAGLVATMRRRPPACRHWLIDHEGTAVGYGMTAPCPGGLGLIEELFTLPERRGRGIMSAFIVAAAAALRAEGCDGIFLDAHAADTPKRLYARLGFAPVAISRTWARQPLA